MTKEMVQPKILLIERNVFKVDNNYYPKSNLLSALPKNAAVKTANIIFAEIIATFRLR